MSSGRAARVTGATPAARQRSTSAAPPRPGAPSVHVKINSRFCNGVHRQRRLAQEALQPRVQVEITCSIHASYLMCILLYIFPNKFQFTCSMQVSASITVPIDMLHAKLGAGITCALEFETLTSKAHLQPHVAAYRARLRRVLQLLPHNVCAHRLHLGAESHIGLGGGSRQLVCGDYVVACMP